MRTFMFVAVVGLVLAVILESANAAVNLKKSPTKEACLLTRLVASSVRLSEEAGGIIKNIMISGDLKIVNKDQTGLMKDLQTEADRSAQMCIEQSLHEKFGENLTIIGEENISPPSKPFQALLHPLPSSHHFHIIFKDNAIAAVPSSEVLRSDERVPNKLRSIELQDVIVWVDPMDGTSIFTKSKKNPALLRYVTVLIGITYKGRPVAGIVHQPFYDGEQSRTVWSIVGVGTFGLQKTGQQIMNLPKANGQMPPRVAVITFRSRSDLVQKALDALVEKKLISEVERAGGAGFKVLRCLEGATAFVYAAGGTKKWDIAAPEALLIAAGGTLSDMSGRQIWYDGPSVQLANNGGLLATAPGVNHQSFVDAIPQLVKDALPEKEEKAVRP
ncbi:hypothetical protein niasHT_006364 [Heterodera trifolii]|uniref:3'(2'),5'-bisphosphate nucleotidase 1 n=1 Tax=Heterodera trifolii TaxID=157864 RepID=A0ABD2LQ10_9BILA